MLERHRGQPRVRHALVGNVVERKRAAACRRRAMVDAGTAIRARRVSTGRGGVARLVACQRRLARQRCDALRSRGLREGRADSREGVSRRHWQRSRQPRPDPGPRRPIIGGRIEESAHESHARCARGQARQGTGRSGSDGDAVVSAPTRRLGLYRPRPCRCGERCRSAKVGAGPRGCLPAAARSWFPASPFRWSW